MLNQTKAIIRSSVRQPDDTINVLTCVSHERYEPNLCRVPNTQFFSIERQGETRNWNTKYAPIPENYTIISLEDIPKIDFDLCISHNPFVHIPMLNEVRGNAIPLINVFHTMPTPGWSPAHTKHYKWMFDSCDCHVSISDFNALSWFMDCEVIHHGMDVEQFCPYDVKKPIILTVANDFINRNWALGYTLWDQIIKGVGGEIKLIGDTPKLSDPADNIEEVIQAHQESLIYLNTSLFSPIPMSVLEAMSCGTCVVSTSSCAIPDFIEHGKDGFLFSPDKPEDAINIINDLLQNPEKAVQVGDEARETIKKKCSINRFVNQWEEIIQKTIGEK
jgi:glycosyltransferase involved in cell wall biosynthesis